MSAGALQRSSRSQAQRAAAELLARWRPDPRLFAQQALGVELWDRQAEIAFSLLEALRVAVRSGHKVGKSTVAAVIAIWWAFTRTRGKVVLCAPTGHQIFDIVWPELRRIVRAAPLRLAPTQPSPDPFRGGWSLPGDRRIFGLTGDNVEALAGVSGAGESLLFVVDEASGFKLWDPIFGNMAGGARLLALGNPTQTSGEFYDAFHKNREFWKTLRIASTESPNVVAGREIIPGLAVREWCEARKAEWGEGSALYNVRVAGEFPPQASNAVIGLAIAEAAKLRCESTPAQGVFRIGVDVARYGDDSSVIRGIRGDRVLPPTRLQGNNTQQVAGAILDYVRKHRINTAERPSCKIDEIGVGAGVVDALGFDHQEVEVFGINVAAKATAPDFSKLRDQLWFACADWLKEGGTVDDDRTLAELIAPTYTFDAQGRRVVESKDSIKKRLKRSPDDADALCLAVYEPPRIDWKIGGLTSNERLSGAVGSSRSFRG